MDLWLCWVLVLVLWGTVSADPPRYRVHHATASFDQAAEDCLPGVLTTLSTRQEVSAVLGLVSEAVAVAAAAVRPSELTFWVGLRKVKNQCMVPSLPLRGFRWMEDGGEDSEPVRWILEPRETCTTVRCAALRVQLDRTSITSWGLIPVTCRNQFSSICKLRDQETAGTPGPGLATPGPGLATPEPGPATLEPGPATPEPGPATPQPEQAKPESEPEPVTLDPRPATQKLTELEFHTRVPEPEPDLRNETGSQVQGPSPGPGPGPVAAADSCEKPYVPESRFITLDRDNMSWVLVECYSVQLEVHCTGRPAMWRLPDGSPADFSTMCHPCDPGFRKDASGRCVDVDECGGGGGGGCRHRCLNTVGSFRCFCMDEDGKQHDEDSPRCAAPAEASMGVLVPVLGGVAALLLLLVGVAVAVKCCLMRRETKRSLEAEMAMKSNDGKDSTNEKAAT